MSECPNCGSAEITFRYGKARWICGSHGHGADYFPHQTAICQLIWSLREELAEAKATLKEHELVCYGAMERGRDAERDRIADLVRERRGTARGIQGLPDYTKGYNAACDEILAAALRSNEHRSNT